jgi:hypothetical protein
MAMPRGEGPIEPRNRSAADYAIVRVKHWKIQSAEPCVFFFRYQKFSPVRGNH